MKSAPAAPTIRVGSLDLDGGTFARAALDYEVVQQFAATMKTGRRFPPVVVFEDARRRWLADGFHRVAAARAAGLEDIDVEIIAGGRREALLYGIRRLRGRGARRTRADKRRAVELLLADDEWSAKSNRWVAEQAGVSAGTVHEIRRRWRATHEDKAERRLGLDGKFRRARNSTDHHDQLGGGAARSTDHHDQLGARGVAGPEESRPAQARVASRDGSGGRDGRVIDGQFGAPKEPSLIAGTLSEFGWPPEKTARGPFRVVVVDPPWDRDDLEALPVAQLAATDAALWLWTPGREMRRALALVSAWGFAECMLLTWAHAELDQQAGDEPPAVQTEHCIVAMRGGEELYRTPCSTLLTGDAGPGKRTRAFYELVQATCPHGSKVELFSRSNRRGWTMWAPLTATSPRTNNTAANPKKETEVVP